MARRKTATEIIEDKIEKLDISLRKKTEKEYKRDYKKERAKYISNYKKWIDGYSKPGFPFNQWVDGKHVKDPVCGEAEWNSSYPCGFEDWEMRTGHMLTSIGQQGLIDKINELVEAINKLKK